MQVTTTASLQQTVPLQLSPIARQLQFLPRNFRERNRKTLVPPRQPEKPARSRMPITLPSFHISKTFITLILVGTCKNVASSSQFQPFQPVSETVTDLNLECDFEFEWLFFCGFVLQCFDVRRIWNINSKFECFSYFLLYFIMLFCFERWRRM